jgi:CheY-like chemotaxis protein
MGILFETGKVCMDKDEQTFLIVEDDSDERSLYQKAIEQAMPGTECIAAADGEEAFDVLETRKQRLPDLILLDINMPVMSGWQFLLKLKADHDFRNIPVIIHSTSSNPRDIRIASDLGALGYCVKADDMDELKGRLSFIADNYKNNFSEKIKQHPELTGVYGSA